MKPLDPAVREEPSPELTNRRILKLYWPLAVSWLMMAIEGPVTTAAIARRPMGEVNTAAMLIIMTIAFWCESPIIDLLTTSTTLAKNRQHFRTITNFVYMLLLLVTLLHGVIAFTPFFWFVTEKLIGVPREIAVAVRPGLMIMLPWSAVIGWRRYLQGLLIRAGETKWIGAGTTVRVGSMSIICIVLYCFTGMPGVALAAVALMAGVSTESIFIHFASRPVIRSTFPDRHPNEAFPPLTYGKLAAFHFPLSMTTMVMFCGMPLVSWALSQAADPVLSLAAYQVCSTFLWLLRSFAYALPEVVITLYRNPETARRLRTFCLQVGIASSLLVLLVWSSSTDVVYFHQVLGSTENVAQAAHMAFIFGLFLPILAALQSYLRGMLAVHHLSFSRLLAAGASLSSLWFFLLVTIWIKRNDPVGAYVALSFSLLLELGALMYAWTTGRRRLALA